MIEGFVVAMLVGRERGRDILDETRISPRDGMIVIASSDGRRLKMGTGTAPDRESKSTTEPGHWSNQGSSLAISFAGMEAAYWAKFC